MPPQQADSRNHMRTITHSQAQQKKGQHENPIQQTKDLLEHLGPGHLSTRPTDQQGGRGHKSNRKPPAAGHQTCGPGIAVILPLDHLRNLAQV